MIPTVVGIDRRLLMINVRLLSETWVLCSSSFTDDTQRAIITKETLYEVKDLVAATATSLPQWT